MKSGAHPTSLNWMVPTEKAILGVCAAVSAAAVAASGYHLWWQADEDRVRDAACAPVDEAVREIFAPVAPADAVSTRLRAEECAGGHVDSGAGTLHVYLTGMTGTAPEDFERLRLVWEEALRDPRLLPHTVNMTGVILHLNIGHLDATLRNPAWLTLEYTRQLSLFADSGVEVELDHLKTPSSPVPGDSGAATDVFLSAEFAGAAIAPVEDAWNLASGYAAATGEAPLLSISTPDDAPDGRFHMRLEVTPGAALPEDLPDVIADLQQLSLACDGTVRVELFPGGYGVSTPRPCPSEEASGEADRLAGVVASWFAEESA